jgi:regulator of RNase E activity RraA
MVETMGLYVIRKDIALEKKQRIIKTGKMIEVSPLEAIDLNNPEDFELASYISAGLREEKRKLLNNLKANLSSPMLSDILDDLQITQNLIINTLKPNLKYPRILGFAKTMRIRKKRTTDKMEDIYKALQSYSKIVPGDIIVVENEIPNYAYFGELNCNLAIRAGATGAIIGGKTRDSEAVSKHQFPVFSTGNTCIDVRGRAVLDYLSKSIVIDDVVINEGDLIFGDNEGIIVVPKKHVETVTNEALKRIKSEKQIIFDITKGEDIDSITDKYGFF